MKNTMNGPEVTKYQEMALAAEALNNQGRDEEAIELLLPEAEQADNQNTSFFNELGIAYGNIGSKMNNISYWEKAYEYHRRAYELDIAEPMYMFNLAMAASWLDKMDEALDLFGKYVATGHQRRRELALDLVKKLQAYDQERIAGVFIEQYNLLNETQYKFETFRKSMFSIPKYKYPAFEIYQMAFIEGRKRSPFTAELMALLRLQRKLIVEVVEPNIGRDHAPSTHWPRMVEEIIYPIEKDALDEVVCAHVLLIDGSGFALLSTPELEAYRIRRPEGNTWFKEIWLVHSNENGETGCLQIR